MDPIVGIALAFGIPFIVVIIVIGGIRLLASLGGPAYQEPVQESIQEPVKQPVKQRAVSVSDPEEDVQKILEHHLEDWARQGFPEGFMAVRVMELASEYDVQLDLSTMQRLDSHFAWFRQGCEFLVAAR